MKTTLLFILLAFSFCANAQTHHFCQPSNAAADYQPTSNDTIKLMAGYATIGATVVVDTIAVKTFMLPASPSVGESVEIYSKAPIKQVYFIGGTLKNAITSIKAGANFQLTYNTDTTWH